MLNISDKEKNYMKFHHFGDLCINGKKYFFKVEVRNNFEMIMERLAKLVDIKCAHYENVVIDNVTYSLSEDISTYGEYISASDARVYKDNLYEIWERLEKNYPEETEFLMREIVKIYLFDIFIMNPDRHNSNWGFLFKDNKIKDVYILDNELGFDQINTVIKTSYLGYPRYTYENTSVIEKNMKELKHYLDTSSFEFRELCSEFHEILTPEVVKNTFDEVEKENNIANQDKEHFLKVYKKNYNAIGSLMNERGRK